MVFSGDPRAIATMVGTSAIIAVILYSVTDQIMDNQNVSGGLWDLIPLVLSLVPVASAIIWVFAVR